MIAYFPSANSVCMGTERKGVTDLIVRFVKVFVLSLASQEILWFNAKAVFE